jgi:hypothetical protein
VEVGQQLDLFVGLDKIGFTPETPEGSEQRHWCDNCQEYTVWALKLTHIIE